MNNELLAILGLGLASVLLLTYKKSDKEVITPEPEKKVIVSEPEKKMTAEPEKVIITAEPEKVIIVEPEKKIEDKKLDYSIVTPRTDVNITPTIGLSYVFPAEPIKLNKTELEEIFNKDEL